MTTEHPPVPPDSLVGKWVFDHARYGPYNRSTNRVVAKQAAAWGWEQAFPEREELAQLLRNLSIHCDHYAAYLQGQNPAYANLAQQTRDDAAQARAAAERLRGGKL